MKTIIKKALKQGCITVQELNQLHYQEYDNVFNSDEIEFLEQIDNKMIDLKQRIDLTPENKKELLEYLLRGGDMPMSKEYINSRDISKLTQDERKRLIEINKKIDPLFK